MRGHPSGIDPYILTSELCGHIIDHLSNRDTKLFWIYDKLLFGGNMKKLDERFEKP